MQDQHLDDLDRWIVTELPGIEATLNSSSSSLGSLSAPSSLSQACTPTSSPSSSSPSTSLPKRSKPSTAQSATIPPPIRFFRPDGDHGVLSNFWRGQAIRWRGKTYATSEHLYQSRKYDYEGATPLSLEYADLVRRADTPYKAKLLAGQDVPRRFAWQQVLAETAERYTKRGCRPRADWNDAVKVEIMREVLREKFMQCEPARSALVATGAALLVEASPYDSFWGAGRDGRGANWLGRLLVELRDSLG